jgi:hypothetical protein
MMFEVDYTYDSRQCYSLKLLMLNLLKKSHDVRAFINQATNLPTLLFSLFKLKEDCLNNVT